MNEYFRNIFISQNRSHTQYFVYHLGKRGFFAEITTVIRACIYSHSHKLQLVLDNSEFGYKYRLGWEDYFEPFCEEYQDWMQPSTVQNCRSKSHQSPGEFMKEIRAYDPKFLELGNLRLEGMVNILRFFMQLLCKPNSQVIQKTVDYLEDLDLSASYTAIHIRRGDKVDDEDDFYPAPYYLQPLVDNDLLHMPLFVLTDDFRSVGEIKRVLEFRKFSTRVVSLADPKQEGFEQSRLFDGTSDNKISKDDKYKSDLKLVAEVLIAARSHYFVGTFKSNVSWSVRALHTHYDNCILFKGYGLKDYSLNLNKDNSRLPKKIVLGFPKCGTTSLQNLFLKLGYRSCHYYIQRKGIVGYLIYRAYFENKPLLHYLDNFNAFAQIDATDPKFGFYWPQIELFHLLYIQYPDAHFILNHRNLDDHFISIQSWGDLAERIKDGDLPYLKAGKGDEQELKDWITAHYKRLEEFFSNKGNFFKFNIDRPDLPGFAKFLGVNPDQMKWQKANFKTINSKRAKRPNSSMLDYFQKIQHIAHPELGQIAFAGLYIQIQNNRINYSWQKSNYYHCHHRLIGLVQDMMVKESFPDFEMVINTNVECFVDFPFTVFAFAKRKPDRRDIRLCPEITFFPRNQNFLRKVALKNQKLEWRDRKDLIFWPQYLDQIEAEYLDNWSSLDIDPNPHLVELLLKSTGYRYILCHEVQSPSFRTLELLTSGCCLVVLEHGRAPFVKEHSDILTPFVHYLPVSYLPEDSPKMVKEKIEQVIQDNDGEEIAHNGRESVAEIFSSGRAIQSFSNQIQSYAVQFPLYEKIIPLKNVDDVAAASRFSLLGEL